MSKIKDVINNINKGKKINKSFENFNRKYNNRTVTLFNQTLELFDEHGDSDAGTVLQIISEELNMLKIKKDKFLKYKKEWRLNFYVIAILSLVMPLILRAMIPDIYSEFMNSFGTIVMIIVLAINLYVIKKVNDGIVILGNGELTKKLNVSAARVTKTAEEKIKAAGGKVEVI